MTLDKALKTYEIFNGLFYADSSKFRPIYDKVKYYIESEVKNCLKKNKNRNKGKTSNCTFTLATNGFSEDLFIESIEATIMCRKIVRFDFFENKEEDKIPDIMVAIYTGVAYSVDPTLAKWRDNSKYWASFSPSDSTTTEDNTSFLEYGSKSSSVPYDLGIMVEISVDNVIPRILADFEIDKDLFKKCLLFYERFQVTDTPFNSSMICSLLSKYIGGPHQIHRVKYRQYRQLVSIVQLRMLQWNLKRLIGFVSSRVIRQRVLSCLLLLFGIRTLTSWKNSKSLEDSVQGMWNVSCMNLKEVNVGVKNVSRQLT